MGHTFSGPRLTFEVIYDKEIAQQRLSEAEQRDFYLQEIRDSESNTRARENTVYAPNAVNEKENAVFQRLLFLAKGAIPHRLQYDLDRVYLVSLMPSADGGMPHTRPDAVICYPDIERFPSTVTLVHELWHLHQRQYAAEWEKIFRELGWERWEGHLPDQLEKHRRLNPDTLDAPLWCFQKTWVTFPLFRDISRPRVGEVDIWCYHVSLNYHVKNLPKEIQQEAPSLPLVAWEHPREWAATLLSDPASYEGTPLYQRLISLMGGMAISRP